VVRLRDSYNRKIYYLQILVTDWCNFRFNAVAMRGVNDDEISAMAKPTLRYPAHLRFIELMPLSSSTDGSRIRSLFLSGREILERAHGELRELTERESEDPAAPADDYKFEGAPKIFGIIMPVSDTYFARCSRLRLTSDSKKSHPCLLTDLGVPVINAIRSQEPIPTIHRVSRHAVRVKPLVGVTLPEETRTRTMSQIGGQPSHAALGATL
jgi:cyclic pyranopterin phosphate synthase